jgi:hypothetical protein
MISYLVDAVVCVALFVTAVRVTKMHRELKRLRGYETEFTDMVVRTTDALDNISGTVHELNANGAQLVHLLGVKIDEARDMIGEIDRRRRAWAPRQTEEAGERMSGERAFMPRGAVARHDI